MPKYIYHNRQKGRTIIMKDTENTNAPDVSVVVLIYNGAWERVRATLNSIVSQKGINFDVIIIDDCSEVKFFDKIKDFFLRHDFTDYRLTAHTENLGIIKTYLEAAQAARTEYMRVLEQGDMFFDEYALRDSYNYAVRTDAEVLITQAVFYRAFSNPVELIAHRRYPQNIRAYDNPDDLKESYLLRNDNISGASVLYRCDVFIQYMKEAVDEGIKYLEDFMIKCMIFDERRIRFLERNAIYYEFGAGISTVQGNDTPFRTQEMYDAMQLDQIRTDEMLLRRCMNYPSEFSEKLAALINTKKARRKRKKEIEKEIEYRQKLKDKLGIISVPVILARRLTGFIKRKLRHEKNVKSEVFVDKIQTNILTDTDVSTEFANFCMNRE